YGGKRSSVRASIVIDDLDELRALRYPCVYECTCFRWGRDRRYGQAVLRPVPVGRGHQGPCGQEIGDVSLGAGAELSEFDGLPVVAEHVDYRCHPEVQGLSERCRSFDVDVGVDQAREKGAA